MNNRIWRFGLVAVAAAALVVIGVVLLTGRDNGAQLSPSSSLAQTPQDATPAQTDAGTLVFSRHSVLDRSYDLYLVRSDGTGLKQLTASPGDEGYAHWSPDGTRIVYDSSGADRPGIFVINADGSERLFLGRGANPSWSPDGKQILYSGFDSYRASVMNADGSGRRTVGVGAPFWPRFATWAPDGRIVFVRVRTPSGDGWSYLGERDSFGGDLYAVNPDGSGLERLTKGAQMTSPSVSPDGSTIAAYATNMDRLIAMPFRADGPAVTLLDSASQYFPGGGNPAISSRWSSDGKQLVLGSDNTGADGDVYTINADGSGLTRIPDVTQSREPDWRPAQTPQNATPAQSDLGTLVITYISEPGQESDVYLVRTDGTGLRRLTTGPANEGHAYWSPDGTRIVYCVRSGIYVMKADGSANVYVAEGVNPRWSPDGKQILYDALPNISVMNADGSGRPWVVALPFSMDSSSFSFPTWAPNGKIVFVRGAGERGDGGDLYAVNRDGSGLERLTKGARMTWPSVSPDGSTVAAYAQNTDRLVAVPYRGDGLAVTLLDRASHYFRGDGEPLAHWAPDGGKLVLGISNNNSGGLYLVNADGSGLTRVPGVTRALGPDWRPE